MFEETLKDLHEWKIYVSSASPPGETPWGTGSSSIEMLWTEYYVKCLFSKDLQQYRKTIIRGGMPQDHTSNVLLELY